MPNSGAGINCYGGAVSNLIGGPAIGNANVISGNSGGGVWLSDPNTTNNTVRGNSIYANAGLGIVLNNAANDALSSPTLFSAALTTNTTVAGLLGGPVNTMFHMDFYANPPPSGDLEGMTYLGSRDVFTGAGGVTNFSIVLNARVPTGRVVSATITDPAGNTSSFSGGALVTSVSSVNDGIPDVWRALYFGGTGKTTNSQSCATCDPDHDGMNNLQEFLAGTNPTNAASALRLVPVPPNLSNNAAGFSPAAGSVYRVQYSEDLWSGRWLIGADQIVGTGTNISIVDPSRPVNGERFYRLQVLW